MAIEQQLTIQNKMGIHVRPATRIADIANRYPASVQIIRDHLVVDAKNPLDILTLAATEGTQLLLRAEGEGEEAVLRELAELINGRFGME